jgi:hypothetical protein
MTAHPIRHYIEVGLVVHEVAVLVVVTTHAHVRESKRQDLELLLRHVGRGDDRQTPSVISTKQPKIRGLTEVAGQVGASRTSEHPG